MAINKSNILLNGISGTIGGQITFSQRNGKTVISRKRRASLRPPTEKQIAVMGRFKDASRHALQLLADPAQKALYEAKGARKGIGAYALAIREAYCLLSAS